MRYTIALIVASVVLPLGFAAHAKLKPHHASQIEAARAQLAQAEEPIATAAAACDRVVEAALVLQRTGSLAATAVRQGEPERARYLLKTSAVESDVKDALKACAAAVADIDDGSPVDGGVEVPVLRGHRPTSR